MGINEDRMAEQLQKESRVKNTMECILRKMMRVGTEYVRKTPKTEQDHAALLKAEQKRQRRRNKRRVQYHQKIVRDS